jgi:hypothetical protein
MERVVALHQNENVLMRLRQSYFSSISPDRIFLTDRRVIIVHNSFWGLYLHFNIFNQTRVSSVMLNNIMGSTVENGKLLATILIRIRGQSEEENVPKSGWHINGVWMDNARKFSELLEEFIENEENPIMKGVKMIEPSQVSEKLSEKDALLVWLGIEPAQYVAYYLGVSPEKIMRVSPADITSMSPDGLKDFEGKMLADYSGMISSEIAGMLKREYGVNVSVLRDGLLGVINSKKVGKG